MAMLTRCPACETTFRVSPEQLQARGGIVRCGRCLTVFDGFNTLAAEPEPAAAEPESGSTPPVPQEPERAAELEAADAAGAPDDAATRTPAAPAFRLEPVSATELAAAAVVTTPEAPESGSDDGDSWQYGPAPRQLTLDEHLQREESRAAAMRHRRWWAAAAVAMALALATHAVFVFRGEIVAYLPTTRPALAGACARIGCEIRLPQSPRQIAIEASDLQAVDPAQPSRIVLTATVRNHSSHDLGYPALDLVLTNTREHTLARRIFQPGEYLEPGRDARAGIPAKGEVTIRLELDTADLNPAGFRLDLMAAPRS